jgi:hypothetical protein
MNEKKLHEEQIRGWIRNILNEERDSPILLEYMNFGFSATPQEGYDTFIAPFVDVLKVAKVATKDILSSAKLNLDTLLTISPTKAKEAREKWKSRKKKIDDEYKEVMKSTDEALSGGDAQLIGFMLNPAGYFGAKLAQSAPGAVKGTAQYLEDAGFDSKLAKTWGLTAGASEPEKTKEKGPLAGALSDLTKLFFITHHAPPGQVLTEAEEEEKAGDIVDKVREHFESLGILDKILVDGKELVGAKIEQIDELMDDIRGKFETLGPLYQATTAEEFMEALEKAKASGKDIGGGGVAALGAELKKSVDDMLQNPKSKESLIAAALKSQGKKVPKDGEDGDTDAPEVNEEALRKEAEKIIFMKSKQSLQEKIYEGIVQLKEEVTVAVMDDVPRESDWKLVSGSSLGKEFIDRVTAAIEEIKAA